MNGSDFPASLEARRDVRAASGTTGPNGGRGADLAIFLGIGTHFPSPWSALFWPGHTRAQHRHDISEKRHRAGSIARGTRRRSHQAGKGRRSPNAEREPVPVAGDAERPMPDARGKVHRRHPAWADSCGRVSPEKRRSEILTAIEALRIVPRPSVLACQHPCADEDVHELRRTRSRIAH